jgi:ABC-type transport system involved in Fe-S cluster assembly fused permease/ATPase subunit
VVCIRGIVAGHLTVGDAVLFLTLMNQLYAPLSFFGSYYRQVRSLAASLSCAVHAHFKQEDGVNKSHPWYAALVQDK